MAATKPSPAILHIRDFIDNVGPDQLRPGKAQAMQIQCSLNIPIQLDARSDDVQSREISTIIRFFCESGHSHLYEPNAFIYAWGSFSTTTKDDELQISLNANAVSRYVTPTFYAYS
jgi:hypothetical protein